MRRRALLATLAATTAGTAGCLDRLASGTVLGRTTSSTGPPPSKPVRCRGDPVAVERTLADEPGYDDGIEYFPRNATVRYVAMENADGPVSFGTFRFREWASMEAAEAGVERVREVTETRLGTDRFGSGVGQPPGLSLGNSLVVRLVAPVRVEDGKTVETDAVELSRLVEAAPRSVDATVSLAGDEFSRTVPVFAERVRGGPT